MGWRPRQIVHLLSLFWECADVRERHDQPKVDKYIQETFGGEAGRQARYQELQRLLEEQIAATEAAFAEEMKVQEQKDAIARDSCLAPEGETWEMLLRQEAGLDRAIDRKVRILLTMRKEHARERGGGSLTAPTEQETSPPHNEANDREAQELSKVVGLDARTESPTEENATETPKSPEQSQNVIENKGSAAERSAN